VVEVNNSGSYTGTSFPCSSCGGMQAFVQDVSGNVYLSDEANHYIYKYNSSGTYQSRIAGPGTGNGQVGSVSGMGLGSR